MQDYFIFDEFDSRKKLLIEDINEFLPGQNVTTVDSNYGVKISNVKTNQQVIKINYSFQEGNSLFSDFKTIREFRNYLAKNLPSEQPKKLYLSTDPDVFYWAIYDGSSSTITKLPGFDFVSGELNFIIPDGIRHGLEEKVFMANGDYVEVKNYGDLPVKCDLDVYFPSDCDYLGLTTEKSITQLGTVRNFENIKKNNSVIFSDPLESTSEVSKNWKKNIAKPSHNYPNKSQLKGNMGESYLKYGQAVVDFGTPVQQDGDSEDYTKRWHGSSLSRYIPNSLANFQIEGRVKFVDREDDYTIFNTSDVKYTVKQSDTLDSIAKKYKIDKKYIKEWNKITSEKDFGKKYKGKTIIVGKKYQTQTVPSDKVEEMKYYYAGKNDTVKHACEVMKVSENNFRSWNKIKYGVDNLVEKKRYIIKKGSSKTAFKNGLTELQAVDEDNNVICGVELKDNTEGYNEIQLRFYIGEKTVYSTKLPREYLDLYGHITIKKVGNRFNFSLKVIDEKTQKQKKDSKNKNVQWEREFQNEDYSMLRLKRIDYIGMIYRNISADSRAVYQSFTHCRLTEITSPEAYKEVFTFVQGDKLELNGVIPFLNGVQNLNYIAIGSDGVVVPPGISKVYYTYPEEATQPEVKVRLREEFY